MIRSGTVSSSAARRPAAGSARWRRTAALVLGVALPLCSAAPPARAEPTAADRRQAEALFVEAKKLEKAGKIAEACRKFESSYRLDPAGGTALNLALCHEKEGKIATAWTELKEALALAKKASRRDRERIARDRIDAIEPRLPYFIVVPEKPDTPGLAVTVDDAFIDGEAWGAKVPIDPGAHKVKATAPNRKPWEGSFEIAEGNKVTVRVPALAAAAAPTATATASAPPVEPVLTYPWMRPAGIAVASVGVAAVVAGAIFGGRALSLAQTAKENCDASNACTKEGFAAVQDGRTSATASDILLGVGAGFAVGGVVLFILGGKTERAARSTGSVQIAPLVRGSAGGATLGLEGAW